MKLLSKQYCKKYSVLSVSQLNINKNYDFVKYDVISKIKFLDMIKTKIDTDTLLHFYIK